MAYREFDPAAMEDYRDSTVQMFQDQRDFAESKVSQLTTKIGELDTKIAALETKISDLNETITSLTNSNDEDGKNNNAISSAMGDKEAAENDKEAAETERTNAQNAVTALNNAITDIDQGIEKTKSFINDLLTNVETADKQFDAKFDNLLEQINRYKSEMKGFYNSVDTTLRSHGYNGNVNLKSQFSQTVNDFADSTMVNTFPYIPERYIYHGGVLNSRVLYGLFQKDLSMIKDEDYRARMEKLQNETKQFEQLSTVINSMAIRNDWKSLGEFISAGYTQLGMKDFSNGITGQTPSAKIYLLSNIYRKFTLVHYQKVQKEIVNFILKGGIIANTPEDLKKELQSAALLNFFSSRMSSLNSLNKVTDLHDLKITIAPQTKTNISGLGVSVNAGHSLSFKDSSFFVSNFDSDLGTFFPKFQGMINSSTGSDSFDLVELLMSYGKGEILDELLGPFSHVKDLMLLTQEEIDKIYLTNANLDASTLLGYFTSLRYGGVMIQGLENEIILSNSILELNGNKGFGISLSAYNHYLNVTRNVDQYYNEIVNPSEKIDPVWTEDTLRGLRNWLEKTKDDNSRDNYYTAITNTAKNHQISLGPNSSYEDYKKIIEAYPDEISSEIAVLSQ